MTESLRQKVVQRSFTDVAVGCVTQIVPKGDGLVGTWQLKLVDEEGRSIENLVQFTKDGKWNSVEIVTDEIGVSVEVEKGTYTVSGNKINVSYTEDGKTVTESVTFEVKSNKLMLTYEDMPVAITFDRVKDSVIQPYL